MTAMTYQLDATDAIRDQVLVGDTVLLSDDNCRSMIRSTLTGGVLKFGQPKKAGGLVMSTLNDCLVDAGKPQRDSNFFTARFINCRFRGVFSGIDFGRGDRTELHEDFGTVEGCDFTAATLDGCRFLDVDVSTLKFPQHDHAVLLDPSRRAVDVAAVQWPGVLGKYMEICTNKPASFKASVMHIPSLARLVRCTEGEVREALQKFGGLVM
jgi:hypothetical protein